MKSKTERKLKGRNNKPGKSNKPSLISQNAYAKLVGVTRQTINQQVKDRIIILVDGKIDPILATKQRENFLNPAQANTKTNESKAEGLHSDGKAEIDTGESFGAARTRKMRAEACRAEMQLKQERGELVRADKWEAAAKTVFREFRDRMLNIPGRICDQLAAENDPSKILKILNKEIKKAIEKAV